MKRDHKMIVYKNEKEIQKIKDANQIVARILSELKVMIKPGVETQELDAYAEKRVRDMGAEPAFKNYRGYPASLCTSINEEIVHGIPSKRVLQEGDIISLDFGVILDGFYGDAGATYPVGRIASDAQRLLTVVEQSLYKGIEQMQEGKRVSDISSAIQRHVEAHGFSVIRSFVGHGVGFSLHEEPQVPNFGSPGHGPEIKKGMILAIEPMVAMGSGDVAMLSDGWTAVTKDRSLSAYFEHTVVARPEGPEILSQLDEGQGVTYLKESQHA